MLSKLYTAGPLSQRGQSLISVLVTTTIMAITAMSFLSLFTRQTKANRTLAAKNAIADLSHALDVYFGAPACATQNTVLALNDKKELIPASIAVSEASYEISFDEMRFVNGSRVISQETETRLAQAILPYRIEEIAMRPLGGSGAFENGFQFPFEMEMTFTSPSGPPPVPIRKYILIHTDADRTVTGACFRKTATLGGLSCPEGYALQGIASNGSPQCVAVAAPTTTATDFPPSTATVGTVKSAFRVEKTGTTRQKLVANTLTTVDFDKTTFDAGSEFDLTTDQFCPKTAGYYQLNARITADDFNAANTNGPDMFTIYLYRNDVLELDGMHEVNYSNYSDMRVSLNAVVSANGSTDCFSIRVMHDETLLTIHVYNAPGTVYFAGYAIAGPSGNSSQVLAWGDKASDTQTTEQEIDLTARAIVVVTAFASANYPGPTIGNGGTSNTVYIDENPCASDLSFEGASSSITFLASASCVQVLEAGKHKLKARDQHSERYLMRSFKTRLQFVAFPVP